jgi:hypothetical protein
MGEWIGNKFPTNQLQELIHIIGDEYLITLPLNKEYKRQSKESIKVRK